MRNKKGQFMKGHSKPKNAYSFKVGHKTSDETKNKISKAHIGIKHTKETKKRISEIQKGRKLSLETRKRMSMSRKGEKSHFWKGGITQFNKIIRNSIEYKLWRTAVFERDNYTCIWCGNNKSGNLNADHIKPFCDYPELRLAIDNGRTLCKDCHRKTSTYGVKIKKIINNNL